MLVAIIISVVLTLVFLLVGAISTDEKWLLR